MNNMMWGYLIHLSDNMWGDPGSTIKIAPYFPELSLDEVVWRQVIDFLPSQGINTVVIDVGDGIQYEKRPEISVKGAWSKEKMRKELDYIRSLGMTPIPKLNFSAGHDAWLGEYSRMLSTRPYYEACRDVITEVIEVFDYPELIHLGMDEEDPVNQGGLSFSCVRQGELWWHDMFYLFSICEGLGVRPWVWASALWDEKLRDTYLKKMPKSVLQSNGWYNRIRKLPDGTYKGIQSQTYCILEEHGFEQVLTCSTFEGYMYSAEETMQLGKDEIAPERNFGYMTAPWHNTRTNKHFILLNDALQFGIAKQAIYPEEWREK